MKYKVIDFEKIESDKAARIKQGWGKWRLRKGNFSLEHRVPWYEIPLGECRDPIVCFQWIAHLFGKTWMQGDEFYNLLQAFEDTLGDIETLSHKREVDGQDN